MPRLHSAHVTVTMPFKCRWSHTGILQHHTSHKSGLKVAILRPLRHLSNASHKPAGHAMHRLPDALAAAPLLQIP